MVILFGGVAACKKDVDVAQLQGTWREAASGRKMQLDAAGNGYGPFGKLGVGCDATHACEEGTCIPTSLNLSGQSVRTALCTESCSSPSATCSAGATCVAYASQHVCRPSQPFGMFTLHTNVNAFGEFLIAFGEDAGSDNTEVIPCGPCKLTDDGSHLSCVKESDKVPAFGGCEFDRVGASLGGVGGAGGSSSGTGGIAGTGGVGAKAGASGISGKGGVSGKGGGLPDLRGRPPLERLRNYARNSDHPTSTRTHILR